MCFPYICLVCFSFFKWALGVFGSGVCWFLVCPAGFFNGFDKVTPKKTGANVPIFKGRSGGSR